MTPLRRRCGVIITRLPLAKMASLELYDTSDDALRDLLPEGYNLQTNDLPNGMELPDWQESRFKKACVAIREVAEAILKVYPKGQVRIWCPEDNWRATCPPFFAALITTSAPHSKFATTHFDHNPMEVS